MGQIYSSKYHATNKARKMNEGYHNSLKSGDQFSVVSCVIIPMHERIFKMKKAEVI